MTQPITPRAFSCRCGRPVFFRNSTCLACQTPLGYLPERAALLPLQPAANGLWREAGSAETSPHYSRCANLDSAAACNWLLASKDALAPAAPLLCRCCRLTRTAPAPTAENGRRWNRIELAKRRLVSSLIGLQLPMLSKVAEDPEHGLAFDLLQAAPGAAPVVTGHADGVITIDIDEADDAVREQRRASLDEPYRTLLGHLRHETGHYYWQRLVAGGPWLDIWRQVFGDEQQDYVAAIERHHLAGAPPDWHLRFVSAYASSHPWEDWAETWAHYLHLVDTLDTARSFGLDGERVELHYERFDSDVLAASGDPQPQSFLQLINSWMELTGVLNELSRSMGVADYYPFVLSRPVVAKLHLVHRVIAAGGAAPAPALDKDRP